MEKNSFSYISERINLSLSEKGFKLKNENNELFCEKEETEYLVKYDAGNKRIELKIRSKSEDGEENDWKILSSWLLDAETSNRDADMICQDFIETILGPAKKQIRQPVKKSKSENGNIGSLFFANRMVNIFPDLKQKIYVEKECYSEFRGVKFTKENIVPEIVSLLDDAKDKKRIEKLFLLLNDLYDNGSLDVRGIITMIILNSIEGEEKISLSKQYMSKELISAWSAAEKFKGKRIKPEKPKKKRSFIADTLSSK